jgi:molybdopterin converting factor small subunit
VPAVTVRVRMFAALREAAGCGEADVPAGQLDEVLERLRADYGPVFSRRLAISTVLLDGTAVAHDAEVAVPDGAELALLPPVSGGA